MTVTFKDLKKVKNQLGQFMTPDTIAKEMVSGHNHRGLVIEPSFGKGAFLSLLEEKYSNVIGIEFDPELFSLYAGKATVINDSFYNFSIPTNHNHDYISFVGNPPYRTPAYSLKSVDRDHVKKLIKKYKLTGIKEEAVFFIAHAVDLILTAKIPGELHWVLPFTIFQNSSNAFMCFRKFLNKFAPVVELTPILENYPDVSQPLCIAKFLIGQPVSVNVTDKFVLADTIEFQKIFKKTWLGSVPCESLLLSCRDEPLPNFIQRLEQIFQKKIALRDGLKFNDKYHLRALSGSSADEKFKILEKYVTEIETLIDVNEFSIKENYKPIAHRNEVRWYFRHTALTKASFIYILNSTPVPGFYFPGNPTKTSTDYFGFCTYDINRNSSPGANRLVPIDNLEENITGEFKQYWKANTSLPITEIFNYIIHVSKSNWYKSYKAKYQRFYFGLPLSFDASWNPNYNNIDSAIWQYHKKPADKQKLKTIDKNTSQFNELFEQI